MQQNDLLKHRLKDAPLWLNNFVCVYQKLSTDNLELLSTIYHNNITFEDPIHKVEGFENLQQYFKGLYQNLVSCEFSIEHVVVQDSNAAIYWQMTYQHTQLRKGKTVTVFGHSYIKSQEDKVIYHRDYLDLGAMIYEQVPVLGRIIRWIKSQAAK